jgi:NodT family efflux transporter outer membrane factor (OMF) lipoprotein
MMQTRRAVGLLLVALPGCSFAPPYQVPPVQTPVGAYQEIDGWRTARPADAALRGPWWELFGQRELDELETRVTVGNQALKAAVARLAQSRATTRIGQAGLFPSITAGATASRSRASQYSPSYNSLNGPYTNDYILDADVSYELDLWGRIRSQVAASRAEEQGTAADVASLELALHAEVASDYFALRSQDAQIELLEHTVSDYEQALTLTQNLYEGGAGLLADVDQAKAQLETARTQVADMHLMRTQTEHALAVLLGEPATGFRLPARALAADVGPPPVDPGLPSTLLERRPDIAAGERRVAAANARIGIARAAYFPVFSLSAVFGTQSSQAASWLTAPARMWGLGSQGLLTVFDGGLHRAQTAAARAAYDEQVASYRGTVLTAYQEVEDSLAALHHLEQESTSEAAAVEATAGALEQAQYRYQGGAATYLEVVVSENAALAARLTAASIQLRRLLAVIQLVKALGGGWQNPAEQGGAGVQASSGKG